MDDIDEMYCSNTTIDLFSLQAEPNVFVSEADLCGERRLWGAVMMRAMNDFASEGRHFLRDGQFDGLTMAHSTEVGFWALEDDRCDGYVGSLAFVCAVFGLDFGATRAFFWSPSAEFWSGEAFIAPGKPRPELDDE